MSPDECVALARDLAMSTKQFVSGEIERACAPLREKIARLEAEVARLDGQHPRGLEYCGTWQRAMAYSRHQGVTHKGTIWVALTGDVRSEPGTSADWQLAAKP